MTPVTFYNSTQLLDLDTLNQLHEDGVIDRVRLDGKDFFVSADVAMDLHHDGIIQLGHEDSMCGRGWTGTKGECIRRKAREYLQLDPITRINERKNSFQKTGQAVQNGRILTRGEEFRRSAFQAGVGVASAAAAGAVASIVENKIKKARKQARRDGFTQGSSSGSCGRGWKGPKGNCTRSSSPGDVSGKGAASFAIQNKGKRFQSLRFGVNAAFSDKAKPKEPKPVDAQNAQTNDPVQPKPQNPATESRRSKVARFLKSDKFKDGLRTTAGIAVFAASQIAEAKMREEAKKPEEQRYREAGERRQRSRDNRESRSKKANEYGARAGKAYQAGSSWVGRKSNPNGTRRNRPNDGDGWNTIN